ncbi:MBL fold metallo-hydrolase [Caenimonas soli]|uniref:MBL fold metallo-hydrolase n=1 Tax=Caenimonas soli TaxID=2735555 RepID=UPI001557D0B8|nr:MBL fold metallo-hydrolase [Caenimonas soli]NPC56922.1 MBL fold metallo-hydrolase [Caenimonas soli]
MADDTVPGDTDAHAKGEYFFLDMGREQYGECTVVRFGKKCVLIDGAHYGDIDGQDESASVPEQLAEIFGKEAPFHFDLVVVTHCHADHIGCLPQLVQEGIVTADWALITHPELGFGRSADPDDTHADLADPRAAALAALLREEDMTFLSDAALERFADAVKGVEARYIEFIDALTEKGTTVIEYEGEPLPEDLVKQLKPTGIRLLGPSTKQLLLCTEQIGRTNKDAADAVKDVLANDPEIDEIGLYRRLLQQLDDSADGGYGRGAAMNCQSITFAFGPPEERVLLAGDMQFADPDVRGVDVEMDALRQIVRDAGPYVMFKTTHHTSHNGVDVSVLKELGNPALIVHSGGWNDPKHPDPSTLETLKSRRAKIKFARTDRNGMICVRPHMPVDKAIAYADGKLNDFSDNARDVAPPPAGGIVTIAPTLPGSVLPPPAPQQPSLSTPQIVIINLPPGPVDMSVAGVEIAVRTPGQLASVLGPRSGPADPQGMPVLASGRTTLPPLLFVTNSDALRASIGQKGAGTALAMIGGPHELLDFKGTAQATADQVRTKLGGGRYAGVVILGGYDVVPSHIVDVLDPSVRQALGSAVYDDHDHYYVWSDELYTDSDGDLSGEFPVSRIPDGKDASLLIRGLSSRGIEGKDSFGIRNIRRPFAEKVWSDSGPGQLEVSETFTSGLLQGRSLTGGYHYHMLHGSDVDGTEFTGEYLSRRGGSPVAFNVASVPRPFGGVVFSGCCWGALPVDRKAKDAALTGVRGRTASESIALSYLDAGANAFVGCTGSHYSGPDTTPALNYAMDFHKAFWALIRGSDASAAKALHEARLQFGKQIVQKSATLDEIDLARRLKNRSQFTCLGLGW